MMYKHTHTHKDRNGLNLLVEIKKL